MDIIISVSAPRENENENEKEKERERKRASFAKRQVSLHEALSARGSSIELKISILMGRRQARGIPGTNIELTRVPTRRATLLGTRIRNRSEAAFSREIHPISQQRRRCTAPPSIRLPEKRNLRE